MFCVGCNYSSMPNWYNIDGLVQDCSNSIANALELLQSCIKPLIYTSMDYWHWFRWWPVICYVPRHHPNRCCQLEPLERTFNPNTDNNSHSKECIWNCQCMKRPVAHSLNSTWFWIELPENCCEPLKFIMKYISIQFCERPGHGRPFHALNCCLQPSTVEPILGEFQ